jgi:hypothetical protein
VATTDQRRHARPLRWPFRARAPHARGQRSWPAFWLPFATALVIAFVGQRTLFQDPVQAWGDAAINGLSVLRAEHLQQLVGNYSRVGFHHPGPGYMYLLGAGEVFFFHLLHVVPAPYNGQLLAVSTFVAATVGATCLVVYRSTRSVTAAVATFAVVFAFAAQAPLFGQDWFPYLYVSSFLLLCVAGGAVAAGFTREWPFVMTAAAFLAHGHASFLMFSCITLIAVLALWWLHHRDGVRAELREHRVAVWATALVAALACLPVLADLVLHFPGEWPKYLEFASQGDRDPRTLGDALSFVGISWTDYFLSWPWFVAAAVAGLVLLALDRTRDRARKFLVLYCVLLLETLLYLYYVYRGVDYLEPREVYSYVGFFYRAVPVVLVAGVIVHLCLVIQDRLPGRREGPLLAAALVLAATAAVISTDEASQLSGAGHTFTDGARTLTKLNAGRDRVIVLQNEEGEVWPTTAALGLELSRQGAAWCTQGPNAVPIMFGADHVCTAAQGRRGMLVAITNQPLRASQRAVWQDSIEDPRIAPGAISAYLPRR